MTIQLENAIDFGVVVGKDELGNDVVINVPQLSHLLIAGVSGTGKSNLLHRIISALSFRISPLNLKFILIDSKKIELNVHNNLPHLLTPVIIEPKKAALALKWAGKEMDRRLDVLQSENVRDVPSYREKLGKEAEIMPVIVIVIDGLSDLLDVYPDDVEKAITRLVQTSQKVGIHLVLSTSRASNKVITEPIKSGIPARIAFKLSSANDSLGIIGIEGAETLEAQAEILFRSGSMKYPICAKLSHIAEDEVKEKVKAVIDEYKDEIATEIRVDASSAFDAVTDEGDNDELYEAAREVTIEAGRASTSFLQRRLGVGYSRAAHLIDMLEDRGVIGPAQGSNPREVIAQNTVH